MMDLESLLNALDTIEKFDPNQFPESVLEDATTTAVHALSGIADSSEADELFARFGRAAVARMSQYREPNKAFGSTKLGPGSKLPKMGRQFEAIFYGVCFDCERRRRRERRTTTAIIADTARYYGVSTGKVRAWWS
ncbi:hypothetical protein [Thiococcus pfennigii]|uniref:hypothetical protein n=1 Tax=Thiococcus pfennigii TaxID=1057 RepID=UPI001905491E|nr:hypothetical protein [Thiococcus pfennigii]